MSKARCGCYEPPFETFEIPEKTTFQLECAFDKLNDQLYWQKTHYIDKTKRRYLEMTLAWIGLIGDELDDRKRRADGGGHDAPKD